MMGKGHIAAGALLILLGVWITVAQEGNKERGGCLQSQIADSA